MTFLYSLLCLLGLAIVLTQAQSYASFGWVGESGEDITFQTSTNFVKFRWDAPGVVPRYALGTASVPNAFQDYTALTLGVADVAGEDIIGIEVYLPAGAAVYVTIVTPAGVVVYQSTAATALNVGSLNWFSCPSFWQPTVGGIIQTPAEPNIAMTFDAATQSFSFAVDATYLAYDYTWVIDFIPFSNADDGLLNSNCENRNPADFVGVLNSEKWNSAPSATQSSLVTPNVPASLNSINYLAYRTGDPGDVNTKWNISSSSCGSVTYTSLLSYTKLGGCRVDNNVGSASSVAITPSGSYVEWEGTVYATAVRPLDPTSNNPELQYFEYQFPFLYTFGIQPSAVISSNAQQLDIKIQRLYFTRTVNLAGDFVYKLNLVFRTDTYQAAAHVIYRTGDPILPDSPRFTATPGSIAFTVTSQPAPNGVGPVQYTTFQTTVAQPAATAVYSGQYTVLFSRQYNAFAPLDVTATFSLNVAVDDVVVIVEDLAIALAVYGDAAYFSPQVVFSFGETVYIESIVGYINSNTLAFADLPASQANAWDSSIYNAWACFNDDGSAPANCAGADNSWQLVAAGVIDATLQTDGWSISIDEGLPGWSLSQSGLSFSPDLLIDFMGTQTVFYIEIQADIGVGILKKSAMLGFDTSMQEKKAEASNPNPSANTGITIDRSTKNDGGNGVCVECIVGGIVGGSGLCLVLIILAVAYRRRQNKKKESAPVDLPQVQLEM